MRKADRGKRKDSADFDSQGAAIEESGDMIKPFARHVDEEELGFDAVSIRERLIGRRYRRDQRSTGLKRGEGTALRVAADQVNNRINAVRRILEAIGLVVENLVGA